MFQISIGNSSTVGGRVSGAQCSAHQSTTTSGCGPRCREGVTLLTVALPVTRHHKNHIIHIAVLDQPNLICNKSMFM